MVQKKGTELMMILVDVDPEHDADFNAWANQEHINDLLKLPGFLNAARYVALKGGPRYLAFYELESVGALQSDEYHRVRQNPTEWTQRVSPIAAGRNVVRNVYTQIYPSESDPHTMGRGMAPALEISRMEVPPQLEAKYNEYYDTIRTPAYLELPGCVAIRRFHAVESRMPFVETMKPREPVVEGSPKYLTMYEFEHENVPETQAWRERGAQDRMHEYIGGTYDHAPGSPGLYRRVFPPRSGLLSRPAVILTISHWDCRPSAIMGHVRGVENPRV